MNLTNPAVKAFSVAVLLWTAAGFPVHAVIAAQPVPAAAASPLAAPNTSSRLNERAARAVARIAILDLRLIENPGESDYQTADIALSLAMDFTPNDADLLRRRIEANWNAGRSDMAIELTKRLIALDPTDTVAQLRYISAIIGKRQTATERLALYERYHKSAKIDPAVRSRLALDAALLAREGADSSKFKVWLKQATTLDSTNKEAAILALSLFSEEHPDDPVGRVELLSNLLMADPLDPHVFMTLARQLAAHGVFDHANRLHSSARDLLRKTGGEITPSDEVEALVLEWQVDGPAKVCARISNNLAAQRKSVKEYNENVRDTGIGIGKDLGQPDDLRLGGDTEKVRLATAMASDNKDMTAASILDMFRAVEYKFKLALDDSKRPLGVTREEALAQANAGLIDLQFWRAIAGIDLDKIEPDLVKFANSAVDVDLPGPDIVRALLTLKNGDAPAALEAFDAMLARLAPEQPIRLTAEYARALTLEALGNKDEALRSFRIVQRGLPLRPIGAMARFRIEKIIERTDEFSPDKPAIAKIAAGIPIWIDTMVDQPKSFMSVLGQCSSTGAFSDDSPVIISIRNISQIPLAVGSDKPINSRFMLAPTLTGRASRLTSMVRPEIFETDRVLRLMPRETLSITVHPDLGYAGFVLDITCDTQAVMKWKLIQGFTPSESGNFIPGPLSLTSETPSLTRNPLPDSRLDIDQLTASLASANGDALYSLLSAARQRLWAQTVKAEVAKSSSLSVPATPAANPSVKPVPVPTPATSSTLAAESTPVSPLAAERTAIAAALAARFPTLPAIDRVLLAAMMPHAGQISEMAPLDAAVRADTDPDVACIALITRVQQPDAPELVAASTSSHSRLAQLAALLTTRLQSTGPTYSRLAPGLAALRGEQDTSPKAEAAPK